MAITFNHTCPECKSSPPNNICIPDENCHPEKWTVYVYECRTCKKQVEATIANDLANPMTGFCLDLDTCPTSSIQGSRKTV